MLYEKLCGPGQGDTQEEIRIGDKFGSCLQIMKNTGKIVDDLDDPRGLHLEDV